MKKKILVLASIVSMAAMLVAGCGEKSNLALDSTEALVGTESGGMMQEGGSELPMLSSEISTEGGMTGPSATELSPKLDALVIDGTITKEQEDAILEAMTSGETPAADAENGPLQGLVDDGTLTSDTAKVCLDAMFGGQDGSAPASLDTSDIKTQYLDVSYASVSDAEKLDIYLPNEGDGPFPVILFIHGGGFTVGSKTDSDLSASLAGLDRGYAVVSVEYRLSGEAVFPAQIEDIKAAIRFLRANAATYNLDTDTIIAMGGSAGGNLAALAGTTGDVSDFTNAELGNADQSEQITAVVDLFGPIDFLTLDSDAEAANLVGSAHDTADSFESKYLGAQISTVPDLCKQASPATYISEDDPYFFIQHGTADTNVSPLQSENFADALKAVLGEDKVQFETLEGAAHLDQAFYTDENVAKIMDWIDSVTK